MGPGRWPGTRPREPRGVALSSGQRRPLSRSCPLLPRPETWPSWRSLHTHCPRVSCSQRSKLFPPLLPHVRTQPIWRPCPAATIKSAPGSPLGLTPDTTLACTLQLSSALLAPPLWDWPRRPVHAWPPCKAALRQCSSRDGLVSAEPVGSTGRGRGVCRPVLGRSGSWVSRARGEGAVGLGVPWHPSVVCSGVQFCTIQVPAAGKIT